MLMVNLVFALLYHHALKSAKLLELDALECHLTQEEVEGHLLIGAIAVLSIVLALVCPERSAPAYSGLAYFLIGPVKWRHGVWRGKRKPKRVESA
jgi:hypothetical protein